MEALLGYLKLNNNNNKKDGKKHTQMSLRPLANNVYERLDILLWNTISDRNNKKPIFNPIISLYTIKY